MKTYCPARPAKRSTSCCTWPGVNATKSTTASNSIRPSASFTASGSLTSARSARAPAGAGLATDSPLFSRCTSCPSRNARSAHAELMMPVPPMNNTLNDIAGLLRTQTFCKLTRLLAQLSLESARRQTADDLALKGQDEDDERNSDDHPGGHLRPERAIKLRDSRELRNGDCDRLRRRGLRHRIGDHELVPSRDKDQYRGGEDPGHCQRE